MPNGEQCCAIRVCCDPAARRALLERRFGVKYAHAIETFMDENRLVFAPASMQAVIDEIADIARKHPKADV